METEHRFTGVLSNEYDLVHVMIPHYAEHEDTVRHAIAAYAAPCPQNVLSAMDLGCGTGLTTKRILEADERITVRAVDNEAAMLRQAKVLLENFSERITFIESDALASLRELDAGSVDIIASGCVLHNLPLAYRRKVMGEAARVLVPGGLFVNADKYGLDDPIEHADTLKEQLANLFAFDEMGRPDLREAWHAHYLEDEEINFTEAEQKTLLADFGFHSIQTIYRKRLEATIMAINT